VQHDVDHVETHRVGLPQAILDSIGGVKKRVVLGVGPDIKPNAPQTSDFGLQIGDWGFSDFGLWITD
jgi:hypothetical protein